MNTISIASYTDCILTSGTPFIMGKTREGATVYVDSTDIDHGFQMFRPYKVKVFEDGAEIPWEGFCHRSKILRPKIFTFLSENLRLSLLKKWFERNLIKKPEEACVVSEIEGILLERLLGMTPEMLSYAPPGI